MKPGMMRWKMTLSYLPVEARVAKFLQVFFFGGEEEEREV